MDLAVEREAFLFLHEPCSPTNLTIKSESEPFIGENLQKHLARKPRVRTQFPSFGRSIPDGEHFSKEMLLNFRLFLSTPFGMLSWQASYYLFSASSLLVPK
jgi:hypothetical protein